MREYDCLIYHIRGPRKDVSARRYRRDVVIPKIEDFQEASRIVNESAVLLMDNCSGHISSAVIELLSQRRVKAVSFPPHTSGLFQILDLVFFRVSKLVKKHLSKDLPVPVMEDYGMRMFKLCKSAGVMFKC
jgi:hypothetical protein